MSLHALQCALAELFTSGRARERYARDPYAFCSRFDLDVRERTQLDALSASAIASYASTLIRKRISEAVRLLPNTRAALGVEFGKAFEGWAQGVPLGEGPRRYRKDAVAFARYLLAMQPDQSTRSAIARELRLLQSPLVRAVTNAIRGND